MSERGSDVFDHLRKPAGDILREEPQDDVSALLQQIVLAPVAAVVFRVREVERPVDLHGELPRFAEKIDFHERIRSERNVYPTVEREQTLRPWHSVKEPEKKALRSAARAVARDDRDDPRGLLSVHGLNGDL